ncbi:MAG TPA: FAD-binding oxidoreductase [Geminicoccaceae bacterium]
MTTADVIIVGAGIAGASMAYELQAFADVALIERELQPGYHATGRTAAVFAPAYGNRVIRALTRASRGAYEQRLGGLAERPVLAPRGAVLIGRPDQAMSLEDFHAEMRDEAPALEVLDAAALERRLPFLRPGYAIGGVFDPDVMDLDVALIHGAYLHGFRRRGGRLVTEAELIELGGEPARWEIRTPREVFHAPMLVNAAGAWADQLARTVGLAPLGLIPRRRTAFVFEPSHPLEPAAPLVDDVDETFYFKPEAGLVLGSPADATAVPPSDVQPDPQDVAVAIERIEQAARFRVLRVIRRWAGLRTVPPDDVPVIGMDELLPGFFWLAGLSGYGIQVAPALGRTAASLLVDGVVPDDLLALGVTAEDLAPGRLRATAG